MKEYAVRECRSQCATQYGTTPIERMHASAEIVMRDTLNVMAKDRWRLHTCNVISVNSARPDRRHYYVCVFERDMHSENTQARIREAVERSERDAETA